VVLVVALLLLATIIIEGTSSAAASSFRLAKAGNNRASGLGPASVLTKTVDLSSKHDRGLLSSPASPTQLTTIHLEGDPIGEAYDPANARLFVADFQTNNISVIDTITNQVVSVIPLTFGIEQPVYDSGNGLVYVGDCCSSVYAINATTNQAVASIVLGAGCYPGCAPSDAAYDSTNGDVYTVDGFTSNLSVIHGTVVVATIPGVGSDPYGIGYDRRNGDLYVSNEGNNSLAVVDGSTNQIVRWIPSIQAGPAVAVDTSNGEVFVGGNNGSGQAEVTIVNGTTDQIVGTLLTKNASGSAAFDPVTRDVYVAQRFNDNDTPIDVWNVSVINATSNRLEGTLPTQRGPIGIAYADFNHEIYVADSDTSNVSLLFPLRSISFVETGLMPGTAWSVTLNNMSLSSNTSLVPFTGADGPYQYAVHSIRNYTVSPRLGSFSVNGTNLTVDITFVPVTFSATFNETGLPNGTTWSISLNGSTHAGATASLLFALKNGTYNYSVTPPTGFSVVPKNGSVTIQGSNRSFSVVFNALPAKPTPTYFGLTATEWELIVPIAVLIAAVAVFVLMRRKRQAKP